MIIKTVQWNIGGGKILREGADPNLLSSYSEDGTDAIVAFLKAEDPDIITLQETHEKDGYSQPQHIADALGFPGWVNDVWADSHVEAGQKLGQGIVSRWPVTNHSFEWFNNPLLKVRWEDGTEATSHDKGRTYVRVVTGSGHFAIQTLHTLPLRRFKVDPTRQYRPYRFGRCGGQAC